MSRSRRTDASCAKRWSVAALVMTAALVCAACESTVAGRAVEVADSQNAGGVTLALLDPGGYPTTAVPLGFPADQNTAIVLEGQRMADAVVLPSEVDSALRQPRVFNTGVVENAQALRVDIGLTRANILAAHEFTAGFSTSRDTEGGAVADSSLVNLVMSFTDQDAASAAVAALAATTRNQKPTPIPRHPDAAASSFDMAHGVIVESFTPRRNYLLYQWARTSRPIQAAAELVAKTLDLQMPRMDGFAPSGPSRRAGLSADPTGLLTHTLPVPSRIVSPNIGVYSQRAALHFQADPVDSAAAFTAAGVEAMSLRGAMVFESRDAAAAANLADQLSARDVAAGATRIQGVAGLPKASCVDGGVDTRRAQPRFHCFASAGGYAYETSSDEQEDARKQAAAQYLILRNYHP